jgi:hypothetical protein
MNERMIGQSGERRNMSALEEKVDALLRFCTAETEEARGVFHGNLRQLMRVENGEDMSRIWQQQRIDRVLADLGIPDHLCGYNYLQTAIELSLEDPQLIYNVTYGLYPAIALRLNIQPATVERNIRHAIECGWRRCDLQMQERYFGGKVNPNRCKPTNREFIARITNLLRYEGMIH